MSARTPIWLIYLLFVGSGLLIHVPNKVQQFVMYRRAAAWCESALSELGPLPSMDEAEAWIAANGLVSHGEGDWSDPNGSGRMVMGEMEESVGTILWEPRTALIVFYYDRSGAFLRAEGDMWNSTRTGGSQSFYNLRVIASVGLVVIGIVLANLVHTRRRRMLRFGRCPACGYDLSGTDHERCPECGAERNLWICEDCGASLRDVGRNMTKCPTCGKKLPEWLVER
jgi:hypothetical protein